MNMRSAAVIEETLVTNIVIIGDGVEGDAWLEANPDAVEITEMDPQPTIDGGWKYVEGKWIIPAPTPLTKEQIDNFRRADYQLESDPIYFQWQREIAGFTKQMWLDKIEEINARWPYPVTKK